MMVLILVWWDAAGHFDTAAATEYIWLIVLIQ